MLDTIAVIPVVGPFVSYAIPFLFVLSVIIFVHELGHYVIGRWCGIGVEVFSVGFGPVIWSRRDRRGTVWQIAAFPLGGYVRFLEDSETGRVREQPKMPVHAGQSGELPGMVGGDRFDDAPVLRRALTVAAGPIANFVLSVILFAGLAAVNGVSSGNMTVGAVLDLPGYEFGIQRGDRIIEVNGGNVADFADIQILISETATSDREDGSEDRAASASDATVRYQVERDGRLLEIEGDHPLVPFLSSIEPLSPASRAGLRSGDLVLEVESKAVRRFSDLREAVLGAGESEVDMLVWREGEPVSVSVIPTLMDREVGEGVFEKQVAIGVRGRIAFEPEVTTPGPFRALAIGFSTMIFVIEVSVDGIYHMIVGNIGLENIQGPLGIAHVSGDVASNGFLDLLWLLGVISVAIGMLNLLPIPVLDGGHLLMFAYEAGVGRRPSDRVLGILTSFGLMALVCLMVFATYNDILRLIGA